MEKIITIRDKLYEDIEHFCNANELEINEYLLKLIEDGFYIEKYGDMNDLMKKVVEQDNKTNIEEKNKSVEPITLKPIHNETEDIVVESKSVIDEKNENVKDKEEIKIKRTRRTIKAK